MAKSSSKTNKAITDTNTQTAKKNSRKTAAKPGGLELSKGKSFRTNPENINRKGRPPKLIHHIVEELKGKGYEPVSESQIVDAYQMLLQLPESGVKEMEKDKSRPFFLRLVAKWMQSNRGMEILDRMLDRSYGKVLMRQKLDANVTTEQPLFGFSDNK